MREIRTENEGPIPEPYEWLTEEHRRSLVRFFQLLEIGERRAQAATATVEPDSGGERNDLP